MVSKTIRDLEAQLAIRDQQIQTLQVDADALRRAIAIMQEVEQQEVEEEIPPAKVIRNTMLDILQEAGEPLHYGAIFDELVSRGVSVPGKDPRRNVGAHLSIDDRFEKQGGGLWGLASWKRKWPEETPKTPTAIDDYTIRLSNSTLDEEDMESHPSEADLHALEAEATGGATVLLSEPASLSMRAHNPHVTTTPSEDWIQRLQERRERNGRLER